MPSLFGFGTAGTVSGSTGSAIGDPSADLVEGLLGQLEMAPEPEEPKKMPFGRVLLGSLGDALITYAAVRSGAAPPSQLPFASSMARRQAQFEETQATAEAENRELRNRIRVREYERRQDAASKEKSPPGIDTRERKQLVTEAVATQFGLDPSTVGELWSVRDRIDPQTGSTLSMEFLGPAEPADAGAKQAISRSEYETTVTRDMVDRFGLPAAQIGRFVRVRDTIDDEGITTRREILGPATESTSTVATTAGIFTRGAQTQALEGPLVHPDTGEPLKPFQDVLTGLAVARDARQEKTAFRLPASVVKDLSEQGTAADAAGAALRRYIDLKSPDLGFPFKAKTFVSERFASDAELGARRAIAEATVPIRKFFLGAAVTESEKASAAPLIANLEAGVPPNVLKESLLGLVNISRRARQRMLLDAQANGLDISGFAHELVDGSLVAVDTIEEFLSGAKKPVQLKDRVIVVP